MENNESMHIELGVNDTHPVSYDKMRQAMYDMAASYPDSDVHIWLPSRWAWRRAIVKAYLVWAFRRTTRWLR
jgi:hypothetical protein